MEGVVPLGHVLGDALAFYFGVEKVLENLLVEEGDEPENGEEGEV